jgi:chromosome segregation ATPase
MRAKLQLVVLNGLGLAVLAAGLARGAEPPKAAEAKAKLEAARAEIGLLRTNIVLTLEQLDQVRSAKDQQGQFERFAAQLTNLEAQVKVVRARAQTMKERGDKYFAEWEARTVALQDPQARQWAQSRYAERKKSYDRMVKELQQARTDFQPMLAELNQIKTLLENHRDAASIAAAKEHFTRANWHCVDVQRSLMQVEAEFTFLAADFAVNEK